MSDYKFHIEHSILVTSDAVTATETTRYIERKIEIERKKVTGDTKTETVLH